MVEWKRYTIFVRQNQKDMPNKVFYEWSLETIDEHGDIIDSDFSDTPFKEIESNQRMCLVRNEGNEADGLTDRHWAFVVDGKLPEYFTDSNECEVGYKVPLKYKAIKL